MSSRSFFSILNPTSTSEQLFYENECLWWKRRTNNFHVCNAIIRLPPSFSYLTRNGENCWQWIFQTFSLVLLKFLPSVALRHKQTPTSEKGFKTRREIPASLEGLQPAEQRKVINYAFRFVSECPEWIIQPTESWLIMMTGSDRAIISLRLSELGLSINFFLWLIADRSVNVESRNVEHLVSRTQNFSPTLTLIVARHSEANRSRCGGVRQDISLRDLQEVKGNRNAMREGWNFAKRFSTCNLPSLPKRYIKSFQRWVIPAKEKRKLNYFTTQHSLFFMHITNGIETMTLINFENH